MTTLTKTYDHTYTNSKLMLLKQKYRSLLQALNFSYFAFLSFTIIISAIIGSGVVRFCLEHNTVWWQFVTGMVLSILNIVVALAQFPVKWILNIFLITNFINGCLIISSFFIR